MATSYLTNWTLKPSKSKSNTTKMSEWVIYSIISLNSDSYSENLKTLEYEDDFTSQELNSPMHMKYTVV